MGKYMKKSKTRSDIGVIQVFDPTASAGRTRAAKTLALKRLNSSAPDPALSSDSSRYLQLRSRRLEKQQSLVEQRYLKSGINNVSGSRSVKSDAAASDSAPQANPEISKLSIGDDFESRHSTSEMEISDYTRDQACTVPTTSELEEFFAYAEKQHQRLFMEKYNFDIVKDMPLTGRLISQVLTQRNTPQVHSKRSSINGIESTETKRTHFNFRIVI